MPRDGGLAADGGYLDCTRAGDLCDRTNRDQGNFGCILLVGQTEGICHLKCDKDATTETCPTGSYCVGSTDFDICLQSNCASIFNSATECPSTGYYGGTCFPYANGTYRCRKAGTVQAGQTCLESSSDLSKICAVGLLCFNGKCVNPCDRGNSNCQNPETCLIIDPSHTELGICVESCTPYSTGECSQQGQGCWPLASDRAMCLAMGSQTEGQPCGTANTICAEGYICSAFTGTEGRCIRLCNPAGQAGDPRGLCQAGEECLATQIAAIGLCIKTCGPWSGTPSCGAGMGCFPNDDRQTGYCEYVGTTGHGQTCAPPYQMSACGAGHFCVADYAAATVGVCEQLCLPFSETTGRCTTAGEVCGPRTSWVGTCEANPLNLAEGASCPLANQGDWCGENITCIDLFYSGYPSCMRLCRLGLPIGQSDCTGYNYCIQVGNDTTMGICVASP